MSQIVSYVFVAIAIVLLVTWLMRRSSKKHTGGH
jgi:hypothetical protein